jgi:hypothetical protein
MRATGRRQFIERRDRLGERQYRREREWNWKRQRNGNRRNFRDGRIRKLFDAGQFS